MAEFSIGGREKLNLIGGLKNDVHVYTGLRVTGGRNSFVLFFAGAEKSFGNLRALFRGRLAYYARFNFIDAVRVQPGGRLKWKKKFYWPSR